MSVVLLAEVKTHLNMSASTSDAEIQDFIDSAEAEVEMKCGPLTSVAKTERLKSSGGAFLTLRHTPVVSLTSITPVSGTAYDVALFETDLSAGVVEWRSGAAFAAGWYVVVYQAGRATVPKDLKLAIMELLRDNWRSQRGGSARPAAAPNAGLSDTLPQSAFTFSTSVMQKLAPHIQVGN